MCGVVAVISAPGSVSLDKAVAALRHRGPDGHATHVDTSRGIALAHTRLAIVDLSSAGAQPMPSHDEHLWISFNGEIYNHVELRAELSDYPFRTRTDTEVILAAYARWGTACLERFTGMFSFVLWDARNNRVFAAVDRFGVKPLYVAKRSDGAMVVASEIKAIQAAGVTLVADSATWATYLATGHHDHGARTFRQGVQRVLPGHYLYWRPGDAPSPKHWYDLAARVGRETDSRSDEVVREEYVALLEDSVRLRLRADVTVGVAVSGGLDSSLLVSLINRVQATGSNMKAFTFVTGDPSYDELPWVEQMPSMASHSLNVCPLMPEEVPALAERTLAVQDEPYGGLPTLAYAKVFERARTEGVIVVLDGQGIDEQWAGYDYYRACDFASAPTVQGAKDACTRPDVLGSEFAALAESFVAPQPFPDDLRNLQYRDTVHTKLPRALRFNDRVAMASSTELREPFLDHRLVELAFRQPAARKISGDTGKAFLRRIVAELVPDGLRLSPKRALQTPQREWLRGPLREWAGDLLEAGIKRHPDWLKADRVRIAWNDYQRGVGDNSFWVWQLLTLGMYSTS